MKLILASDLSFLLKYGYDLTGIPKDQIKIGHIAIRETGFVGILKELLDEGKVYIGTSAGSYIMCPTIEVSDWNPDGKDRFGVTDFTALNYVPFVLKVHYKDEQEEIVRKGIKTLKYPIHILKDGQGMFCEDGVYRFIGDGAEIKF